MNWSRAEFQYWRFLSQINGDYLSKIMSKIAEECDEHMKQEIKKIEMRKSEKIYYKFDRKIYDYNNACHHGYILVKY
jgi:hypothetical protein